MSEKILLEVHGGGYRLQNSSNKQHWLTDGELTFQAETTEKWNIIISVNSGQTYTANVKFRISETSGSDFEEGKASKPSIDYPSKIYAVKDNIKIIQCNSNFLKRQEKIENISAKGLVGQVIEDGTIILNGITTSDTYIQITDELKITDYNASKNYEKHTLPKRKL